MGKENIKPEEAFKWVLYGTGAYALYKVGTAIGLFKTAEDKAFDNFSDFKGFDPFFWQDTYDEMAKKNGYIKLVSKSYQSKLVKQLYDSQGLFNDNENSVYDVFKQLNYQTALSQLSYIFSQTYSESLYDYLTGFMSDSEMRRIYDIVKNYKIGYSLDGKTYK